MLNTIIKIIVFVTVVFISIFAETTYDDLYSRNLLEIALLIMCIYVFLF